MARKDDDRYRCIDCAYWDEGSHGPVGWGLCHANPPTVLVMPDGAPKSWRPSTRADAIACTLFEPLEEEEPGKVGF